ncbi:hypothetical protein [Candidatus Uabimicrobium sp. HlEnr_7]|uniref:hypothetical protein n=1 Tax=Candidatus Uabimicrobium helgolandensis TaxID=3095367 RepID=UPI003557E4D0
MLNEKALRYIDWEKLSHAYNSAYDVPFQIRALTSKDKELREKALSKLYSNIIHQGTRYEATSYTIPFFYQLLSSTDTPDKHEIVELLSYLAVGYPDEYVANGLNAFVFRQDSQEHEVKCYNAVQNGVCILVTFLGSEDIQLRIATIYILSLFPENSAKTLPLLAVHLSKASNAVEIVNLIFTIGMLADADVLLDLNLHSFLSHHSEMVRVLTAFALARDFISQDIVDILANAIPLLEELAKQVYYKLWYIFQSVENYIDVILSRVKTPNKDLIILELQQKL